MARCWCLKSRPNGPVALGNFELVDMPDTPLRTGEVRVRNLWLSVDPSMRVRMNAVEDGYMPRFELNAPLTGGAVGEVVESRAEGIAVGEVVNHMLGWRDESVVRAEDVRKLPQTRLPVRYYLHLLGVIGYTAHVGLKIAAPKPGETAFISAAGGAVGLAAVQMAKIMGLTVIGSAGGATKCELVRRAGADATIDYKAPGTMYEKLKAAAPQGIDIYFDNVGGDHLDAALGMANLNARMAISGMVGTYDQDVGAAMAMRHMVQIVTRRIRFQGFMARDNMEEMPGFRRSMIEWLESGRIVAHETIFNGLEAMPAALVEMFRGTTPGKPLINVEGPFL